MLPELPALEVGIVIPDFASDLIEQWWPEEGLIHVLMEWERDLAKKEITFNGPVPPPIGGVVLGTVRYDIDFYGIWTHWRVEGLPPEFPTDPIPVEGAAAHLAPRDTVIQHVAVRGPQR